MQKVFLLALLLASTSCSLIWKDANRYKEPRVYCPDYRLAIVADVLGAALSGYIMMQAIDQYNDRDGLTHNDDELAIISAVSGVATFYYTADALGGTYEHFKCR